MWDGWMMDWWWMDGVCVVIIILDNLLSAIKIQWYLSKERLITGDICYCPVSTDWCVGSWKAERTQERWWMMMNEDPTTDDQASNYNLSGPLITHSLTISSSSSSSSSSISYWTTQHFQQWSSQLSQQLSPPWQPPHRHSPLLPAANTISPPSRPPTPTLQQKLSSLVVIPTRHHASTSLNQK